MLSLTQMLYEMRKQAITYVALQYNCSVLLVSIEACLPFQCKGLYNYTMSQL